MLYFFLKLLLFTAAIASLVPRQIPNMCSIIIGNKILILILIQKPPISVFISKGKTLNQSDSTSPQAADSVLDHRLYQEGRTFFSGGVEFDSS